LLLSTSSPSLDSCSSMSKVATWVKKVNLFMRCQ
jgi:hypothetical protein